MPKHVYYPPKRTCKSVHDFSLLLTEMRFLNSQDALWEERPRPRYFLADTGIFGRACADEIWIFFPKSKFPLKPSAYCYKNLEDSLHELNIDLENIPKVVTGYTKYPKFNYVLRKHGAKDSYSKNVGTIYNWLGFIRPTENGRRVHAMIDQKRTNKELTENLLEVIINGGLKLNVK